MEIQTTPYWWEERSAAVEEGYELPKSVDVAIIGAGFTGLSAAVTAVEKGASAVVIDSGRAGEGASSRNGGMIGAPHRPGFVSELKTYGQDLATRLVKEGMEAYEFTRQIYESDYFDSGFAQTGRVQLAFTAQHFANMREQAAQMQSAAP